MLLGALGLGVAMGIAIAAPVGPVAALCIERAFVRGAKVALVTAFGAGVADAAFGTIASFGVGFVTDWVRAHEVHLRVLGAVLLSWLAVRAWQKRDDLASAPAANTKAAPGLASALATGFLLTASSPVTIVTFAVALASFGGLSGGEGALERCAIPCGVLVGSGGWYGALSIAAWLIRSRVGGGPAILRKVARGSAAFLAGCAIFSAALAWRAFAR